METSRVPDSQIIVVSSKQKAASRSPNSAGFIGYLFMFGSQKEKAAPWGGGLELVSASLALAKLTMPSQLMLPLVAAYAVTHTGFINLAAGPLPRRRRCRNRSRLLRIMV